MVSWDPSIVGQSATCGIQRWTTNILVQECCSRYTPGISSYQGAQSAYMPLCRGSVTQSQFRFKKKCKETNSRSASGDSGTGRLCNHRSRWPGLYLLRLLRVPSTLSASMLSVSVRQIDRSYSTMAKIKPTVVWLTP